MDERDGAVGLVLAALLAWLLPAAVSALAPGSSPRPSILARAATSAPGGLSLSWASPGSAPDGWVCAPDGSPLHPVPGWRGLLLGHPLDLNTATATDLEALPGIGPHTAAAVLAHRDASGPFLTVDQLSRVKGVGPATLRRLGAYLRVSPPLPTDGRVPRVKDAQERPLPTDGRVPGERNAQEPPPGPR